MEAKLRRHGVLFEHVSVGPATETSSGKSKNEANTSTTGTADDLGSKNPSGSSRETLEKHSKKPTGTSTTTNHHKTTTSSENTQAAATTQRVEGGGSSTDIDTDTDTNCTVFDNGIFDEHGRYSGVSPLSVGKFKDESGFVAVYIDDLIVFSQSAEDHKRHLLHLLDILSKERLYLNNEKSHYFCKYTRYLGAVCGNGVLLMCPEKIRSIVDMPVDKNPTSIKGFLGAAGFYRRWIADYAKVTNPLNSLLKKGIDVETVWAQDHTRYDNAVQFLKDAMTKYPVLRQPDYTQEFVLYTDACDYAIGGALTQKHDGKPCVVAYISRSLLGPELNYSVQEKEALGIVHGVKKFRKVLLGSNFTIRIITDHNSLQYLSKPNETGGRMSRWAMIMSEYNYSIEYLKGELNTVADALSRLITVPDNKWIAISPDDQDSDASHPFLLLWPEVYLVVCSLIDPTTRRLSSLVSEYELGTVPSEVLDSDAQWAKQEEKLNSWELDNTDIENALFLLKRVTVSDKDTVHIQIDSTDYIKDSRWTRLYQYLDLLPGKRVPAGSRKIESEIRHLYQKFMVQQYFIDEKTGLLYQVNNDGIERLCIPDKILPNKESLHFTIFREIHESPMYRHRGFNQTLAQIRDRFFWPRMDKDVKKFYNTCEHCQNEKIDRTKPKGLLVNIGTPVAPGLAYNLDFVTDLPRSLYRSLHYDMALVVVDRCSFRVYILPCRKTDTAESTAELFFDEIVCKACNGVPLYLVSDRDTRFNNAFWKGLHRKFGTQVRLSSARSQQTNGLAERTIAVIEECLRSGVNYQQDNWVELGNSVMLTLNSAPKIKLLNKSPLYFERGVQPLLPIDCVAALQSAGIRDQDLAPVQVLDRVQFLHDLHMRVRDQIIEADLKITYYANQKRIFAENFKVGELVRLSLDGVELNKFKFRPSKKLNPVWYGPYRITGRPSEISCELDLQDDCYIQNVFPMSKLKLASDEQFSNLRPTPLPPVEDEEGEFELEKILDHDEKRKMYYCKWKNYDEIYRSTWEPRAHLAEGKTRAQTKILDAYEKKHDLVALLSEGEAENVASCLLDQSKNRKRQRLA